MVYNALVLMGLTPHARLSHPAYAGRSQIHWRVWGVSPMR
jgi:hypothetical protein